MLRFLAFLAALAFAILSGASPLIELSTTGQSVQGIKLAHDKSTCWLADLDGRLVSVSLPAVTDYREVAPEFKPRPAAELRKKLGEEFGAQYETASRGQYVVCAPKGKADHYASLFDETSRDFLQYLKVRRFELDEIELPLVAVVMPNRNHFLTQCAKDDVPPGPSLRGYYDQRSNRVTLYDDPFENVLSPASPPAGTKSVKPVSKSSSPVSVSPASSGDLARDTAMHEAIHQLAFNTGLHTRVGENPLWVVEGLAMQFECGPKGYLKTASSDRVNVARLKNFDEYRRERRTAGSLAAMLAGDESFRKNPLDAYGEAWLFTNYLIETRSQKYGWYLKTLATRHPMAKYPAEERLSDFKANFGDDLAWLEVEFLRYAEKLAVETTAATESKKKR